MRLFSISEELADKTKLNFNKKKPVIASRVANAGVAYGVLGPTQSRTSFQTAEYNLGEISKVMDIESYVRQAFNKHVELCLKEGYDISSRNEEATLYIKKRMREMAEVSGLTFDMILRSILQNIVAYANSFVVKVRDFKRSSGMPIKRIAGPELQPVAAYFPMDPTSIRVKRDFHGKVLKYWQRVPGNPIMPQFIPEDIIHIYYDKKEGFAFGTPYVVPVLDDIRSLRRMEENVEMLINAHLFPLYHYVVGTETAPAEIYEDGTTEVDVIKQQIERMPTEGSIVTPERHEIKNLGAQGKALDAEAYLKYFERRVIAGLGISDISLGRGDTANRATASTIDKSLTDRCKDFQTVVENFINEYMFKELLFEGGYAIDEKEDNFVKIKFREIDIDNMLKVQNHSVFKYEHHAITETEMREELAKDPVSDEQRALLYLDVVQKPTIELEGKVQAAALEKSKQATTNRNKPTNQHGTKPAKTAQKRDSENMAAMIDHLWHLTKLDMLDMSSDSDDWKSISVDRMVPVFKLTSEEAIRQTIGLNIDHSKFKDGIEDIFKELGDLLCKNIKDTALKGELVFRISGVFESLRFKLQDLCERVIL
jgi:hypothetical protein